MRASGEWLLLLLPQKPSVREQTNGCWIGDVQGCFKHGAVGSLHGIL